MRVGILNVNGNLLNQKDLTYDDLVILGREYYKNTGKLICDKALRIRNNLPSCKIFVQILRNNNVDRYKYYSDVGYPLDMIPGRSLPNDKKVERLFPVHLSDGRIFEFDFCDFTEIADNLPMAHCHDQYGYKYIVSSCMIRNGACHGINFHRFRYDKPVYLRYNIDKFLQENDCVYKVKYIPEGCMSKDNIELISIYGETRYTTIPHIVNYPKGFTEEGRARYLMIERTKYISKEEAIECIKQKCLELGRPLTMRDILEWYDINRVSIKVVNKYWGTLSKMSNELGLFFIDSGNPIIDYDVCIQYIKNVCENVKSENREEVALTDFNDSIIGCRYYDLVKCLRANNTDIYNVIKEFGCTFVFRGFGHQYVFEDGEIAISTYEYDFSKMLKECGFVFEETYFRDVPYSVIDKKYSGLMNCDYQIICGNKIVYVELCGMLNNTQFAECYYLNQPIKHQRTDDYRIKLNYKKELLERNNLTYYFVLGNDLNAEYFRNLINEIINIGGDINE